MIVRTAAAIIDRCLAAAAPWIDCWAICDTGSSDGTGERIRRFFEEAGIPGELHDAPFVDFASARNAALEAARASREPFDYILFADADMELVVEDPGFRERLGGEVYLVTQRAGISYRNVRLLRRDAAARYVGATHEYLETAARPEPLDGLWFRDHADGSNRAEKLERDLRLLGAGLEREPENARYMFYLAQTLRDAGRPAEALEWYRRRVAAGGSAEEAWYAAYAASLCLRDSGDAAGFVRQAWEAYEARPWRAEPLYHLAVRYRETGRNESCVAACEVGERIPYPAGDALFVEDQVYASGFRAEIAIAGFYCADAARRRRARAECLSLSTDPSVPPWAREGARANSAHYARRADEEFGGCDVRPLEIPLEAPWFPLNPSIWIEGERRLAIVRSVNYAVDDFRYTVLDGTGLFRTRNWLATLDAEFRVTSAREIRDLARGPARHPSHWDGFEDCRLFSLGGRLHASATVLDRSPDPRAEIALLELDDAGDVTSVEVQRSVRPDVHQKNWVPLVRGGELLFVYKTDPTVLLGYDPESRQARVRQVGRPPLRLEALRGGSQAIRVPGGWLYVAHEVVFGEPPRRKYLHRFVLLDEGLRVAAVTDPFTFLGRDIELCAGLARDGESGRLVASFGVDDARACVALLDEKAVLARLGPRADAQ
jgi:glycosyltransferase involved in cell wall biosynthesis